jgi:hypothetical protein
VELTFFPIGSITCRSTFGRIIRGQECRFNFDRDNSGRRRILITAPHLTNISIAWTVGVTTDLPDSSPVSTNRWQPRDGISNRYVIPLTCLQNFIPIIPAYHQSIITADDSPPDVLEFSFSMLHRVCHHIRLYIFR